MEITKYYSSSCDLKKRSSKSITAIILHYTGMQSERESLKKLTNSRAKVSCHYLINRKGKVFSLVRDNHIAWHA
ncbi:MAG: N-acetylmuramoyl-L-alanine amidase, partial [Pelagibacteraceae bacterium]|nr:N-acetylmuramoyl-L-alanine amidase [Pelagibacteraceae bacterium]